MVISKRLSFLADVILSEGESTDVFYDKVSRAAVEEPSRFDAKGEKRLSIMNGNASSRLLLQQSANGCLAIST
jgi:hypothetical protein